MPSCPQKKSCSFASSEPSCVFWPSCVCLLAAMTTTATAVDDDDDDDAVGVVVDVLLLMMMMMIMLLMMMFWLLKCHCDSTVTVASFAVASCCLFLSTTA